MENTRQLIEFAPHFVNSDFLFVAQQPYTRSMAFKRELAGKVAGCAVLAGAGAAAPDFGAITIGTLLMGAAGNVLHETYKDLADKLLPAIFYRNPQLGENHQVLLALRKAHLRALGELLRDFDSAWITDSDRTRKAQSQHFSKELAGFINAETRNGLEKSGPLQELERQVFSALPAVFEKALVANNSQANSGGESAESAAKAEVVGAILTEVAAQCGTTEQEIPPSFCALFHSESTQGWYNRFARAAVDELKNNDHFKSVWTAEQLAKTRQALGDYHQENMDAHAGTNAKIDALSEKLNLLVARSENNETKKFLPPGALRALAERIRTKTDSFSEAQELFNELLPIAVNEAKRRGFLHNVDDFINEALKRADSFIAKHQREKASKEYESALAHIQANRTEFKRNEIAVLDALIDNNILNLDLPSAAKFMVARTKAGLGEGDNLFESADQLRDEWYQCSLKSGKRIDRELCAELAREMVALAMTPLQLGGAYNNLGIALREIGEHSEGAKAEHVLNDAIAAFHHSLEFRTQKEMPIDWARTQNNLRAAMLALSNRSMRVNAVQKLWEAVDGYRQDLEIRTREKLPEQWSITQHNLGVALTQLGERDDSFMAERLLLDAIAAFHLALEVRTREAMPAKWAMTQNSLGIALKVLGERWEGERAEHALKESEAAYRQSLEVYTRNEMPMGWARTQNNLGNLLLGRSKRIAGVEGAQALQGAISAYQLALEIYTRKDTPTDWAMATKNLGLAFEVQADKAAADNLVDLLLKAQTLVEQARDVYSISGIEFELAKTERILSRVESKLNQLRKV